jgi:hypothetical protein
MTTAQIYNPLTGDWNLISVPQRNEFQAAPGDTQFNLTFVLTPQSIITVNGLMVPAADYTGNGTQLLTFTTALQQYDNVTVKE